MARGEAIARMLGRLCSAARPRGMTLAVEQHLEHREDVLDMVMDVLDGFDGGLICAPALVMATGEADPRAMAARCAGKLIGLDLTDRRPNDLEPRAPGDGVLAGSDSIAEMLEIESLRFVCVDGPLSQTQRMVEGLNGLARGALRGAPA
jgi:sugar phosphate isomerase/epimerase